MYFRHSFRGASFFPLVIIIFFTESFSVTLEVKIDGTWTARRLPWEKINERHGDVLRQAERVCGFIQQSKRIFSTFSCVA